MEPLSECSDVVTHCGKMVVMVRFLPFKQIYDQHNFAVQIESKKFVVAF